MAFRTRLTLASAVILPAVAVGISVAPPAAAAAPLTRQATVTVQAAGPRRSWILA